MARIRHNKLIRDKLPGIIESKGQIPHYHILDDDEFTMALDAKLVEETNEFVESNDTEELADVMQVVLTLLETKGLTLDQLLEICHQKEQERGAFGQRVFLEYVEEGEQLL